MAKEKWLEVGSVLRGKTNGKPYIKLKEDVTLAKGTVLQLQDPREQVDGLVARGVLTEEAGAARKAKIPDYVRYAVVLPPQQD